ncbi:MAG: sugar phosphate isomerase/epimerase [Chloroflexi bacterium]|nr:sugar phosphate isomerase/epimerase [Chloroflexota bacterium]
MPTFSLSSVLFVDDKDGHASGDPVRALDAVAAAGFRETELLAEGPAWESGEHPDPKPFQAALKHLGLRAHSLHAPYTNVNLASLDERERTDGVRRVASAFRFLGELGGRTVIVHSHLRRKGAPAHTPEMLGSHVEASHRSIADLVPIAQEAGVRMALENLASTANPFRPLQTMQELRAFISAFPREQVGICHDIGHTRLRGLDVADQTRIAGDRLYAVHMQDGSTTEDDHLPPGRGVIDFDAFGRALKDIAFDGAWTFEIGFKNYPGSLEEAVSEVAAVRERWEKHGIGKVPPPR